MKITRVETLPIDRYLFVQIHTDAGSSVWARRAPGASSKRPNRVKKFAVPGRPGPAAVEHTGSTCIGRPTFARMIMGA
jgi:hypothetical protein